jgi:uncharacterized protein YdbL (DUF1318 family)
MRNRAMLCLAALGAMSCLPSKQDVDTAQALLEMGDAVNDIRQTLSDLQSQLDSLREIVVKRDSTIKQLANLAGVTVPP